METILVGAVIGAIASVPVTLFVIDPLRAFIQRLRFGSPSRDLDIHGSEELKQIDELEAEVSRRKKQIERTKNLLNTSRLPDERTE